MSFTQSTNGFFLDRNIPAKLLIAFLVIAAMFSTSIQVMGQSYLGSLAGNIKDSNGAAIAGATVTVTNEATGEKRTDTTNDSGGYVITNLPVGEYTIVVTANGFQEVTAKSVKVSVAFTKETDFSLSPSGVAASVNVSSADSDLSVNTNDQQMSTLLNNKKINDLPLLSRDPNALVLLAPGSTRSNSTLGGVSVNGQRERNNNFLVDGVDNNDTDVPGILGGVSTPNIDATEEFRVISNNATAEFGRNSGGVITVATKGGSNEFHGGAYIYYRSDAFAARNFFDTTGKADPLQRRQFGGKVGGPIFKDRTFFFVNVERDIFDQGLLRSRTVPSARARLGLFDLPSGTFDISSAANNRFGLALNPAARAYLNAMYPLGNAPGSGALPGIFDTYRFSTQTNDKNTDISTKIDHRFNDKHSLTGSFAFNKGEFEFCCETFDGLDDAIKSPQRGYRLSLNYVSIINNAMTNEFRFGANNLKLRFNGAGDSGVSTKAADAALKLITDSGGSLNGPDFGGKNGKYINLNLGTISDLSSFDSQDRNTGTITIADNFSWVTGNHIIKFGGENRMVYSNGASNFGRQEVLNFDFSSQTGFRVLNNLPGGAFTGANLNLQNFASFLYGLVAFQTQTQYFDTQGARENEDTRRFRMKELDFYVQDSWKIRPNLTLNYGVRYEYKGVPTEKDGLLSTLLNQDPSSLAPAAGFEFSVVGKGTGNKLWDNDLNNFAPRLGFAWSPGFDSGFLKSLFGGPGKTSVRGGFGIYYDRIFTNLFANARANPPFQTSVSNFRAFDANPNFPTPTDSLINDYPRLGNLTPSKFVLDGQELGVVIFPQTGNNAFQDKFATPYAQKWNFGFQRQVGSTFLLEADYVGSKTNNLLRSVNGNRTSVGRANQILGSNIAIDPFSTRNNFLNGSLNSAFNVAFLQLATGHATYHSGQFRVTQRLKGKFGTGEIQGSYTWSHAIDNANDGLVAARGERTLPRDSSGFVGGFNAERGNSGTDVRHIFVGNMTYDFPFKFNNSILNVMFADWTMSGIWFLTSGTAFSVFGNTDSAGTGVTQRANFVGSGGLTPTAGLDPRTQTGPTRDQFTNPLPATGNVGVQGTSGRGAFRGPGFNQVDFSMIKKFKLGGERYKFTLRADFFNLFNTVNFLQPVNTVNSANFGQSTEAFAGRRIQFAGRFDF